MSRLARIYWLIVTAAGFGVACRTFVGWHPRDSTIPQLVMFALAAVCTSGFKVRLPGINSCLSINYVFIIAGLLEQGLPSGIVIGAAGVLFQTFYKPKNRPQLQHLIFNVSTITMSVAAASLCLDLCSSPLLKRLDPFSFCAVVTAASAYFVLNTLILAGIIALTSNASIVAVWKESYIWTAPQYVVGGVMAICFDILMDKIAWGVVCILPIIYLIYRSYNIYLTRVEEEQKRVQEQKEHIADMAKLHMRTIEALALAIDAKDDTTAAHLRRVQIYAGEVGKELGLSEIEMEALHAAAILHDIGKLAVPEYIISKPGRLTPEEFEKMKIHPIVGGEILERVQFPYPVVPIVRGHHEKFNGMGYPDGLKGEEIPIGARILSVVDCLDALASDRQYRKAMPLDEAIKIIVAESGASFDPKVVKVLAARYRELEAQAKEDTVRAARISNKVKVERGLSPATGFAEAPTARHKPRPQTTDFHGSIVDARREFQMLVEIAGDLGTNLSLKETLALLSIRLEKTIDHDSVAIYVRQGNELVPRYVKGESSKLFSSLRIPLGQGLSGWVAENDKPIVNGNPIVEAGYLNDGSKITHLRSAIVVPLQSRDQVVGVLALYHLEADAFTQDHRRILLNISGKVGAVIENGLRFEEVQNAVQTDQLTGLLNLRALREELTQRVSSHSANNKSLAVIVMDLDGFKKTNDEHGHLAGNRILQHIGTGLKKCCRSNDLVARLGGDEFVIVLSDLTDGLPAVLDRVSDLVVRAPSVVGTRTPLAVSAGFAILPDDASDAESLLELADERMYQEKRRRKAAPTTRPPIEFPKGLTLVSETKAAYVSRAHLA